MRTTEEWWAGIKNNDERLVEWLKAQYHGEATAANRIRELAKLMNDDTSGRLEKALTLGAIADQEERHATWIGELLRNRGVEPTLMQKDERYWNETLNDIDTLEKGAAVAAHAEAMRLERIKLIAADLSGPEDIRETFRKILPEEEFHAKAFRELTTIDDLVNTNDAHVRGLEALGLIL